MYYTLFALASVLVNFTIAVEPRIGIGDVDPKFHDELKAMKASLESVQGTLITSVRLIQDQLDQFSTQMTSAIDSRMGQMEAKLERFETSMKKLDERSEGWSAMQHHILSWGDQMISLDSKVDHLARSQMERLTTITGQANSLQSTMSNSVEILGEQITNLEGRMHRALTDSNPEIISSLQRIESKLASSRIRAKLPAFQGQHGHSGSSRSLCANMKSSLDNLTIKMETALSAKKCYNNEVTTDVGTQSNDGRENRDGTVEETDFDMSFTGFESETPNDQQLIKLFRRLTLPFKKANRRLRDMEDIGRQLESTMGEIRSSVQIAAADFDQKFNDFFNMTLEMFEHQHHQFELGDRKLGGIKLSCSGIASDLSDFKAKTEAFLDKIESGSLMSGSIENESRSREALRFESARILSVLKDHENLMIDGFDSCSSSSAINRIAEDATEITLTAPVQLEPSTTPRTPEITSTETEVTPIDSVVTAALVEGQPQIVSEAEKVLQTCEQLMEAGFLENKVYNMEGLTEESSSFRKRFCDQTTSGGGWTVPTLRASNILSLSGLIIIACLIF